MKLKCKKIRNIEKSICTCEQKIAYNYAFMYSSIGKNIVTSNMPAFSKSELYHDIENMVIRSIKGNSIDKKYNIDAIIIAFRQGFENYCRHPFIATNYEDIGKCFIIPYDVI